MSTKTGLSSMLKAFQNAIIGAQKLMQVQHINQLQEYIDKNGRAITLDVQVPNADASDDQWRTIQVPKITLSPPSSLKIKKMKVRFKANIGGVTSGHDENCDCHELQLHMGGIFSRSTEADIEIEFEGTEPPEGFMKVNDELVKAIY